jgi:hypothetical protein
MWMGVVGGILHLNWMALLHLNWYHRIKVCFAALSCSLSKLWSNGTPNDILPLSGLFPPATNTYRQCLPAQFPSLEILHQPCHCVCRNLHLQTGLLLYMLRSFAVDAFAPHFCMRLLLRGAQGSNSVAPR